MFKGAVDKAKDVMYEFANNLVNNELIDPKNSKEAKELDEKFANERHSLLGEVTESAMARWTPALSKFLDLGTSVGLKEGDPEIHRFHRKFESYTAWTMFIPNKYLKYATNPILKIPGFKKVVELYPLGGKVKKKLLNDINSGKDVDPDHVVNFLRLVHQDIVSGKVAYDAVAGKSKTNSNASGGKVVQMYPNGQSQNEGMAKAA